MRSDYPGWNNPGVSGKTIGARKYDISLRSGNTFKYIFVERILHVRKITLDPGSPVGI